jgi:hypothetical protein
LKRGREKRKRKKKRRKKKREVEAEVESDLNQRCCMPRVVGWSFGKRKRKLS